MHLVSLKRYDILAEAELAANLLKEAGVRCVVQRDAIPGLAGVIVQGAELFVNNHDLEKARDILSL